MSIIRQGFESADLDVPVVLPTLNLDFANSQSLDKRITFSRGSIGTFVNKNGLIETASANQPRFDFDPISGECRGLLIEESRTNLITSSNNFGGGDTNLGVTASATTSPDGTTNASKLFEKTTNNYRIFNGAFTTIAGTACCGSVFVKAGENATMYIKVVQSGGAVTNEFAFNMNTGAYASASGLIRGAIYYGNGWWRVYSVITPTVTSCTLQIFIRDDTSGSLTYQGDGSSGYYVYGMQAEQGAFPTSYIPTTASTVTRSADNASMAGTNFSSWYNQTESTIFCKFNAYNNIGAGQKIIIDIRGSAALGLNLVQLQLNYISATSQHIYHNLYQNGVNFADYFALLYTTGPTKNIMRYKDLDTFVASKDGNIRSNTSRNKTIPLTKNMDSLTFGTFNGAISKFAYYPKALNDAEIQYLTQ